MARNTAKECSLILIKTFIPDGGDTERNMEREPTSFQTQE